MSDPSTSDVLATLTVPEDPSVLGRRRFLQAAAAAGTITALPGWLLSEGAGAAPLGLSDGVLVIITMAGGNDALDTVVPVDDSAYYASRGSMALAPNRVLGITNGRGLHPALTNVHAQWNAGRVAIIDGVGHPEPDLSHFTSMARVWHGSASPGPPTSGWLGRYLDQLDGADPIFAGVSIGSGVPLVMAGHRRRAIAVPRGAGSLFDTEMETWQRLQANALTELGLEAGGIERGPLAHSLAANWNQSLSAARSLGGVYDGALPTESLDAEMTLAARLINADLGVRIIHIAYGDFDSHAGQPAMHGARMAELDRGIGAFFAEIDETFLNRSLVLTSSEFGRRIPGNASAGTDHGAAGTWLAIGAGVRGGFYGNLPSLARPDRRGNIPTQVDYRQVYTTVLDRWLGGDGADIVGASHHDLGFLESPTGPSGGGRPTVVTDSRRSLIRLYLAFFGRLPDFGGLNYWLGQRHGGRSLASVAEAFSESDEFSSLYGRLSNQAFVRLVYRNVMGREPDSGGLSYWAGRLTAGATRGQVMVGFSDSDEYQEATRAQLDAFDRTTPVARLYHAYFLREPDTGGLTYWLDSGRSLSQISQAFSEMPEFVQTYGTLNGEGFVRLVYRNVMDRAPDAVGLQFWLMRLANGMSRGDLMLHFSESPEFRERVR